MTRRTPNHPLIHWMTQVPDQDEQIDGDPPSLIVTESSVWLVTADAYLRSPRAHQADRPTHHVNAIDGRLDDNRWHRHRGASWSAQPGWTRLRIRPETGPTHGYGIVTGGVLFAGELIADQHHFGCRSVEASTARQRCSRPRART